MLATRYGWLFTTALGALSCSSSLGPSSKDESSAGGSVSDTPAGGNSPAPTIDDVSSSDLVGSRSDPANAAAGSFQGRACATQTAGAEVLPAVLELLVDTSGSMNDRSPGTFRSKWAVTSSAVLDGVGRMPAETAVGVVFYPNVPMDAMPCFDERTAVEIAALGPDGSPQRQLIEQAFESQAPNGGTPTHDAYRYALSRLGTTPALGRRFVVLITDGIPTFSLGCVEKDPMDDAVDATPLIEEARNAVGSGVRTFIVGSPGSEDTREGLSRMAEAGGTPLESCSHTGPNYCHFDMTQEDDLAAALQSSLEIIAGVAVGCDYAVPEVTGGGVLEPGKVNVLFTPPAGPAELIGQSADSSCSEGWQYDENMTLIRLCPSTCERVRASNAGALTLEFGCITEVR